jgi:hypothetical protein
LLQRQRFSGVRPALLGRALSPGAVRQDRHASLRRDLRGDKILLTTLRTHEEVREAEEIGHPDLPLPDPPMLEIAEKIIDQQRANSIRRSSSIATRRRCAC